MPLKANILDENGMMRTITRLAHEIIERNKGVADVILVGIVSRGMPLAKMIATRIAEIEKVEVPLVAIDITFYTLDDTITGVRVSGHAGYDDSGKDIVCSAVSALTINLVNSVDKLTEDKYQLSEDEKTGLIDFLLLSPSKDASLLFRSYEIGVVDIYKTYEQYIKIYYKEVKIC